MNSNYNPDVLSCIANLSSDEVFTPPHLANQLLDLLPKDIWADKDARFLDPACKTGVFLREIARRLDSGLINTIPDKQKRINHIFKNQLFGLSITELTSMISRRTLYCSKTANGKYSVCDEFTDTQGNIRFKRIQHKWINDHCLFCGVSKQEYDRGPELETYAYQLIHTKRPEAIYKMKFDVIIGNPPYQLSDGGDENEGARNRGGAIPVYDKFVQQAMKLNPRYLCMIIPSRWFSGGRGLDDFRHSMLNDTRLRKLVDYPVSSECFPGVEIKGGVCYFLWDRDNHGKCEVKTLRNQTTSTMIRPLLEKGSDIFVRYNEAIPILRKVLLKNEKSFCENVSHQKPFGLRTFFKGASKHFKDSVTLFGNNSVEYVDRAIIKQNEGWIDKHKIFISMAYGAGEDFPHQIINKPFYGAPNTCCTETYLVIGPYDSKVIALNAISYICTRFFRFLVLLRKNTQHAAKGVYSFVPVQNFNENWTDKKLYDKYGLTKSEIVFVESMIRPVEPNNE